MQKIPLTKGYEALVSDEDYPSVSQFKWYALVSFSGDNMYVYAVRGIGQGRKKIYLHRAILGLSEADKLNADHINHNTLDNTRENLRIVSVQKNSFNRRKMSGNRFSRYKGVSDHRGRFRADITVNGKKKCFGIFDTEVDAALAYNKAAVELHGDSAYINEVSNG